MMNVARLQRTRYNLLTELKAVDADIAAHELCRAREARERAMTVAVARSSVFRDGTPRNMPAHREIARRYAWHAHKAGKSLPRPQPGRTGKSKLIALLRLRELERIISSRHGGILPNTATGHELLCMVGHHIAHCGSDAERHIVGWAGLWAPWMAPENAAATAAEIVGRPLKFKADTLGWRIQLSKTERESLGITTIGAFDQSKAERVLMRKIKRAGADLERRRQKGAIPRLQYEAKSKTQRQPWAQLGMSRTTWYRRGMPMPDAREDREDRGGSGRIFSSNTSSETSARPAGDSDYAVRGVVSARAPAGAEARAALVGPMPSRSRASGVLGRGSDRMSETRHPPSVHGENRSTSRARARESQH